MMMEQNGLTGRSFEQGLGHDSAVNAGTSRQVAALADAGLTPAADQIELLRSVVVRSPDAVLIFDGMRESGDEGRIIYANPAFERLSQFPAAEIVGRSPSLFEAFGERGVIGERLLAEQRAADGWGIEFQWICRSGQPIWVEGRLAIAGEREDGAIRWIVFLRDIGERRRAQLDLLHAKEAAESANQAKGRFLATMSHELRTPLNAIIGFSELIEQGVERDGWSDAYADYLHDISASGRHLLSLINTILDLSKIESGMIDLEMAPVDVTALIEASAALVAGLARDGGIELRADCPASHPEIVGDFVKLKQVLINVLSNAIKFTPPGGTVTIGAELTDNMAVIAVADTGCGMSPEDVERAVLPFVQLENSLSRRHPGTGLGLSISKQLCELHQGRFEIESCEGTGTTVRIALPLLVGRLEAVSSLMQDIAHRP